MSEQDVATVLEALMARHGWTVAEVHRRSGVAHTTLYRITDGKGARRDTLAKLDGLFGLAPGTLRAVSAGERDVRSVVGDRQQRAGETPAGYDVRIADLPDHVRKTIDDIIDNYEDRRG